jgi:tRNA dimethylallyltransferase
MSIIVIVGPTASGKSDYAISLAHEVDGEIISADSRQVYRGMDIGTGKVTRDKVVGHPEPIEGSAAHQRVVGHPELDEGSLAAITGKQSNEADSSTRRLTRNDTTFVSGGIRHHLLDVASPKRSYTVTHFLCDARLAISDIQRRGKTPIICGGTNFWIEALIFDTEFPEVKPDPVLRKELAKLSAPELFTLLREKDPDRAESIDRHNKVRLIRALEIVATLGKVPKSDNNEQITDNGEKHDFHFIGIDLSKDVLHERIEKRLKKRLDEGMIEEVKRLHEQEGLSWKRLDSFGLEYRWCARFLQGKIHREEMEASLLKDSRYYAKRQMTSLRRLERKGIRIEWVGKNS